MRAVPSLLPFSALSRPRTTAASPVAVVRSLDFSPSTILPSSSSLSPTRPIPSIRHPIVSFTTTCQRPSNSGCISFGPRSCAPTPFAASLSVRRRLRSDHRSPQRSLARDETERPVEPIKPSTRDIPSTGISRSLDAARQRTRAVREKVRSSLTGITPHENIYTLPNLLTVTRLFAAPATAYLLLHDHHHWALALFAYAGVTDLVDGWIARRWNVQTVAGSVIDPIADKALMIILTVTLAVKGAIPLYLATLVLGRDAALTIAAFYYRGASLPAPKTFMRYWDFSLPSAEVHPTTVSKYNTFLQLILIGSTLALPVVLPVNAIPASSSFFASLSVTPDQLLQGLTYLQWLVAGTTIWSGFSYAFLRDAVTILGSNEALKAKQGARGRAIIGTTFGACVLLAAWYALTVDQVAVSRDEDVDIQRSSTDGKKQK